VAPVCSVVFALDAEKRKSVALPRAWKLSLGKLSNKLEYIPLKI
jgi:hypothetical protein